jgi:hypothetical protein
LRRYGGDLVCVRYRYDDEAKERLKTVEIVVERVGWVGGKRGAESEKVRVRVEEGEELLRRAVLFAGGRWDEGTDTWELPRKSALALGLKERILRRLPRTRLNRTSSRSKANDPRQDRKHHP